MIKYILLFCLSLSVHAADNKLSDKEVNKIADAIKKIENSIKYPYGIKSIPIKGNTQAEREAYARKACIQTIVNNYVRWQKTDKKIDYITFLGNRFCPIGASDDPTGLNRNWIRNLRAELAKKS